MQLFFTPISVCCYFADDLADPLSRPFEKTRWLFLPSTYIYPFFPFTSKKIILQTSFVKVVMFPKKEMTGKFRDFKNAVVTNNM